VKVLVVEQGGCVSDYLVQRFTERNRPYARAELSLLDNLPSIVKLITSSSIGIVVSTCEASELNQTSLGKLSLLAQACNQLDMPLIQLSSAKVFDGHDVDGPISEGVISAPESLQAQLYAELEAVSTSACSKTLILRVGDLFGACGANLLTEVAQAVLDSENLKLSDQRKVCPVNYADLARVVSALVDQISCDVQAWGYYHYQCSDPVNHYQFAEEALAIASQTVDVSAVQLTLLRAEYVKASTPQLKCEKLLNTFGIKQLPWRATIANDVRLLLNSAETLSE